MDYKTSNRQHEASKLLTQNYRRTKKNIEELDISIEDYLEFCKPVSYDRKDNDRKCIGFIAQEVNHACFQVISVIENTNMVKETEDDPPDGLQASVSYDRITAINASIIRKLITKIATLEETNATLVGELGSLRDIVTSLTQRMDQL